MPGTYLPPIIFTVPETETVEDPALKIPAFKVRFWLSVTPLFCVLTVPVYPELTASEIIVTVMSMLQLAVPFPSKIA